MDELDVTYGVVGVQDVAGLDHAQPDALALGVLEGPSTGNRTGRVTGREQHDVMALLRQPAAEEVHDKLGPAVEGGWNRGPRGGDDSDPHPRPP